MKIEFRNDTCCRNSVHQWGHGSVNCGARSALGILSVNKVYCCQCRRDILEKVESFNSHYEGKVHHQMTVEQVKFICQLIRPIGHRSEKISHTHTDTHTHTHRGMHTHTYTHTHTLRHTTPERQRGVVQALIFERLK